MKLIFRKKNSKSNEVSSTEIESTYAKIPRSLVAVIGLILIASTFSLIRDLNASNLKPFGVIQEIIASVLGSDDFIPVATAYDPANLLVDSFGRCEILNPSSTVSTEKTVAEVGLGNDLSVPTKAGLNNGSTEGSGLSAEVSFINNAGLNMSYLITIITQPSQVEAAVKFIQQANDEGYMPIVRLCYPGGCGFKLDSGPAPLVDFFTSINKSIVGSEYEYIGIVGPNEPGTAGEMESFFDDPSKATYQNLISVTQLAASSLQTYRVVNGGNMHIAPAAFNITNRQRDDVAEYLSGNRLDPTLYDVLLGNTYNIDGPNAHNFYIESGMRDYVVANPDLYTIITEFGGFGGGAAIPLMKQSYDLLCNDETIDGIMFFRPSYPELPASPPRQEPPFSSGEIKDIIRDCTAEPQFINKKNKRWIDCNFDSCISKAYKYSSKSIAKPVAVLNGVPPEVPDQKAWLEVSCAGGGCSTSMQKTIQTWMPIRSFGSNLATNSVKYRSYTPACAQLSREVGNPLYDSLNQFAGKLTEYSGGSSGGGTVTPPQIDSNGKYIIVGDSNSAPEASRGTYLPNCVDGQNCFRKTAVPGKAADSFANEGPLITLLEESYNFGAGTAIIMLGTNDCPAFSPEDYEVDMRKIVQGYKSHGINVALVQVPYRSDGLCSDEKIDQYNSKLSSIASSLGATFIPIGYDRANKSYLTSDGFHLNQQGYDLVNSIVQSAVGLSEPTPGGSAPPQSNPGTAGMMYPMPWLGSAINCMAELAKYSKDFAGIPALKINAHPFSKATEAKAETMSDLERELAQKPFNKNDIKEIYKLEQENDIYIPDERTVCLRNKDTGEEKCMDNSPVELIRGLREYNPFEIPSNFFRIDFINNNGLNDAFLYLEDREELIPGPEVVVGESSESVNASEICWRYGIRAIHADTTENWRFKGKIDCKVNQSDQAIYSQTTFYPVPTDPTIVQQQTIFCRQVVFDAELQSELFFSGKYNKFLDEKYKGCFEYLPKPTDLVEKATTDYPSAPTFAIEGIYDALYTVYKRLDTVMSQRLKKIVYRQNLGWRGQVDKIIRDKNKPVSEEGVDLGEYLFKGEYDSNICEEVDFFENDIMKANGTAVKQHYLYYEWLGYLDFIQEWISAYANNSFLPTETRIDNPFYNLEDETQPNFDKEKIIYAGQSSTFTGLPLYTCDQITICQKYSNSELYSALRENEMYGDMSDEDVQFLANSICPFPDKIDEEMELTCIADRTDERFEDELATFLCAKGYDAGPECLKYCPVDSVDDEPIVADSEYQGVQCPLDVGDHYCFQGPYGSLTHCQNTDSLPLDLYPDFSEPRNYDVKAPEDGVIEFMGNPVPNQGYQLKLRGAKSNVVYSILHLQAGTVPSQGSVVRAGQKIGEVCRNCTYDYDNYHIHVYATFNNQPVDPYLLYGEILGCRAKRPPEGSRQGQVVNDRDMCLSASTTALNDNSLTCLNSKPKPVSNSIVIQRFESYKIGGTDSGDDSGGDDDSNSGSDSGGVSSGGAVNNCSGAVCSTLNPKNGISYPGCPAADYSLCNDPGKINQLFGNGDPNLPTNNSISCDERIATIGASVQRQVINFLGVNFDVNVKIINTLRNIEKEIQSQAVSYSGNSYVFRSGSYSFIANGAFNARRVVGTNEDDCSISNHSWGTALDLNATTNGFGGTSCQFDMPPEVVYAFEKYGFRWGGRYGFSGGTSRFDPMHFEYCSNQQLDTTPPGGGNGGSPVEDIPSYCPVPDVVDPTIPPDNPNTGPVTKEDVLNLCSPNTVEFVNMSVNDVYTALRKVLPSLQQNEWRDRRIQQILEKARSVNLNPAYLFAFWFTEGGYLGDGVAGDGTKDLHRNAYGFDFGCGVYCRNPQIAFRDGPEPTQSQYDEGFNNSLSCATRTFNGSCNLACRYDNIPKTATFQIPAGPLQQPGMGGFLECYGPVVDGNAHFARNFIKIYDAFFPPNGTHSARRMANGSCQMYV